jgi:hypothetical protein
VGKGKNAQNVNKLVEAIEQKMKVVLKNYSSANSNEVSSRIVEPFKFTTNYIQIWAYEPSSCKISSLKYRELQRSKFFPTHGIMKKNIKPGSSMFSHKQ